MPIIDAFRDKLIETTNDRVFFFDTETTGKGDEAKIIHIFTWKEFPDAIKRGFGILSLKPIPVTF